MDSWLQLVDTVCGCGGVCTEGSRGGGSISHCCREKAEMGEEEEEGGRGHSLPPSPRGQNLTCGIWPFLPPHSADKTDWLATKVNWKRKERVECHKAQMPPDPSFPPLESQPAVGNLTQPVQPALLCMMAPAELAKKMPWFGGRFPTPPLCF